MSRPLDYTREEREEMKGKIEEMKREYLGAKVQYIPKDVLPVDPAGRKAIPLASGVLDYFPAALVEVAKVSKAGNDQHNPGQPLHWNRSTSSDFADTIMRHLIDRGKMDSDGARHSAKLAWRALALLQVEMEEAGAPLSRGSKFHKEEKK